MKYGYNLTSKSLGGASSPYSAQATAVFDAIGDVPEYAKVAANDYIQVLIDQGVWDTMPYLFLHLPTRDKFNGWMNAKTLNTDATFHSINTLLTTPYLLPVVTVGSMGADWEVQGNIQSGLIPNDIWTAQNVSHLLSYSTATTAKGGYNMGVNGGATATILFYRATAGNTSQADLHGQVSGKGRIQLGGIAEKAEGTHIFNRKTATDFKQWFNNVELGSANTTQTDTLPLVQLKWNVLG